LKHFHEVVSLTDSQNVLHVRLAARLTRQACSI
jgi:hypothetical protein